MIAQLCDYSEKHWIIYFKWVNCMVYELYLNEDVAKKEEEKQSPIPFKQSQY